MLRVATFLRAYLCYPLPGVVEEEVLLSHRGREIPATYLHPRRSGPFAGWVVLHGITVPGRHHVVMKRFAHAFAATGAAIVIPDIAPWRDLRIDMAAANEGIEAALDFLDRRPEVAGLSTLVGFSFGATHALAASARPSIRGRVGTVVSFGGYYDLRSTLRFMLTGLHEWEGRRRRVAADPYGGWIAVANFLLDVPRYAHMRELAEATDHLAKESGKVGAYAGDAIYDRLKAELRAGLPGEQRELWDLVAPPSGVTTDVEAGLALADELSEAALRKQPEMDPREALAAVPHRVVLAHGYDDLLIPYTESLRLRDALAPAADVSLSLTRLYAHSAAGDLRLFDYPRELVRYLGLLHRALPRRPRVAAKDL